LVSVGYGGHSSLWTGLAKLIVDYIGHKEIVGVNGLSRLSRLNSGLKRWPHVSCLTVFLTFARRDLEVATVKHLRRIFNRFRKSLMGERG
jgi:hypothetical protein